MLLILFTFLQVDVSMMPSIIKQIISLVQSYWNISWIAQECAGLSEELFLMCTSVQTIVTQRYQQKQFERGDEKDKFYIYMFFVNSKRVLLVAFIRYSLSYTEL